MIERIFFLVGAICLTVGTAIGLFKEMLK